ncbi:MAG: hypothetical protein JWO69_1249 [Thermoleophilia bacterium]|jgi:hypothetical protein|nr:hypothetical protein [Thermoleophilia bacterium]
MSELDNLRGLQGLGTGRYALSPKYIFGRSALAMVIGGIGIAAAATGPHTKPNPGVSSEQGLTAGLGAIWGLYGAGHALKGVDYIRHPAHHPLRSTGFGRAALAVSLAAIPAGIGVGALVSQHVAASADA